MNPAQPSSFHGTPGYGQAPHPAPTPAAHPVAPSPVPTQLPTLTVRPNGDVTITKALLALLPHLKDRAPIDLVPPVQRGRGGTWHLDTRPTAPRRLPDPRKVARFSIPPPDRKRFQVVAAEAGPGRLGTGPGQGPRGRAGATGRGTLGTVGNLSRLTFQLGPEVPGHPGYYELIPVRETV